MDKLENNLQHLNNNNEETSLMKEFYRNKVVFLTGSTGVLGELFLEKLLRCNVQKVYILLRPKKNTTDKERLTTTFTTAIYDRLAKIDPTYFDRIHVINGDLSSLKLGISAENINKLSEIVDICIHGAADVRFDTPILEICSTNLRGTNELIKLAKSFKKLISFIYLSTAYCHSHTMNSYTKEKFYKPPVTAEEILKLCDFNDKTQRFDENELLSILTPKFLGVWPNTYTFSKAVTESLIQKESLNLPITVVRPSIVIATYEDPIPGYCTNYFGLNGVLIAGGAGLSRVMIGNPNNRANIICADFVINSTLAIIWHEHKKSISNFKEAKVYTINANDENLTWGIINDTMTATYQSIPWISSTWSPKMNFTCNPTMEIYMKIVYQLIPGLIIDIILKLTKNAKRILPMYRKVIMFMCVIQFYMANEWKFDSDNIKEVHNEMNSVDRVYFSMGLDNFDWYKFTKPYCFGLRRYFLKETLDTLPAAKKLLVKQRIVHKICLTFYYTLIAFFWYFLFRLMGFNNLF